MRISTSRASTSESRPKTSYLSWLTSGRRAVEACRDIGLPYIDDINSPEHPAFGCGRLHFTRDSDGHRNSTYHAFLPKVLALKRKDNLHICTTTMVSTLEIEVVQDGRRVVQGVHLFNERGEKRFVRAVMEVVLCAGPFSSPQILMLR